MIEETEWGISGRAARVGAAKTVQGQVGAEEGDEPWADTTVLVEPALPLRGFSPGTNVRAGGTSIGRGTTERNHCSGKPIVDGWLSQFNSGSICSRGLSVTRRTFFTVFSNTSTAKGFTSVAAS